jgi:CheY-like chemotaxis protein
VGVRDLLARCSQSIEAPAHARSIDIAVDARVPAVVDGDPVRLEEVFCNLMSNAIKYSPERTRIDVVLHADDQHCVVDVIDQGIGIAPEMLPRVFDLFAQDDASLARSQGGLGIGLTVVKALVELHRGTVSAASEGKGKGSRFRVELPIVATHAVPASDDTAALSAPGVRVLLVEDNLDVLALTSEALAAAGCEVMTASDGPSGLELLGRHEFDIAFVDIGLPGIDGYEVARRARAQGVVPRLVAVSGYGQDRDRERALAAGFDSHLTKPVSIRTILNQAVDPRRRPGNPRDSDRLDRS